jgi:hypothetical protein
MNITLSIRPLNPVNSAEDTCKNVLLNAEANSPEIELGVNLGVSFSADGTLVLLTGDTEPVLLAGAAIVQSGLTDSPARRKVNARQAVPA